MKSREAVVALQEIQAKFNKKFSLLDLMNAWPQLLTYRADCMAQVAGRIVKSSKYLPKMDYILKVLAQMDLTPCQPVERLSRETEAKAVFRLMAGQVLGVERVEGLYWLADRTQKPHYAFEAWELEKKILTAVDPKPIGQNLETSRPNW